ncbi:C2H2 finger domain transcription factor [Colletotrichum karsti]|uniref:C2H2 finger domain transcription factor n=1 Tax=Colletotrichum karsti TaxID=1095194 RepID=A0A9P6I769_9PEZI|nr:C2H2 finger domain transcription factor [Colletotrichum karsti]KAF9877012.1 C2H2 finger domain transcription factor [Colletotrichum karsti]
MEDSQTATTGIANYRHNSESSDGYLGEEKSFVCPQQGCNKRFTRAEHMQRHALNHQPGGLTCDICRAHFKRPDLLKRHMDRHRQKDLEAGGPGCGVLDTRKRSWKAPDGSVVEKRPCTHPPGRGRAPGRARQQTTQVPSPEPEPTDADQSVSSFDPALEQDFSGGSISPEIHRRHTVDFRPGSFDSNQSYPFDHGNILNASETVNNFAGFPPALQFHDFGAADNNFDIDSGQPINWGDPFASEQLDYDQIFQPDTASSFNMPYTTALDYNWLFNMQDTASPVISSKTSDQNYDPRLLDNSAITKTQTNNIAITPESIKSAQLWSEPMDVAPHDTGAQDKPPSYSTIMQSAPQEAPVRRPPPRNSAERNAELAASRRPAEATVATARKRIAVSRPAPILEPERPLSSLRKPLNTPTVDDKARERLLNTIEAAKPCLPDQRYTLSEHPLLSAESLNSYLDLFFSRFNTAYPLMHLETFNCAETEPLLLLSILLLGATYSSKDCHQLAVCIHDVIRPSIFAHAGFSPRPELWTLQTILLVECFGKSRAGQKQHDMSHLFHGLLINLIRRSDCQSVRPPGPPPVGADDSPAALDKVWRKWAEAEQKKRLALLCFMWDTQHAVLFCQSLCMSAFELRLELPCNQSIWEARDASSWASAWRSSINDQRTFYLPVLKAYLMPSGPRTHGLSGFSRILVLHGLMSVAWDMGRRDQTALGVISGESPGPGSGWRKTLSSAYDAWRYDFDWYCNNFFAQMPRAPPSPDDEIRKTEFESFTAAYKALYHSAQALLNMDFLDVQIYAGARHILGRPVQQKDYMRSAQVVKRWAVATGNGQGEGNGARQDRGDAAAAEQGKQSASTAAWHAAQMLRETKKTLSGTEAMNLFHVPWCLYLATLTCWAFHHARPNRNYSVPARRNFDAMGDFDEDEDGEEDEMIWDPQGEMDALVASMSERVERNDMTLRREKRRTNGLVWIMADILTTVRWGIVHAGVVVLRGLVPQRLINQYEEAV